MIGIINYGLGNLFSVSKALSRLGSEVKIIDNPEDIFLCSKLILPGVGHAGVGMRKLSELGFVEALNKAVLVDKKPILGICLGLQLMSKYSEEGDTVCLGWFDTVTKKFDRKDLHVPHMGWNTVDIEKVHPLLAGLDNLSEFYFAHSYYLENYSSAIGVTEYGIKFGSVFVKDNIMGVQFHPEKSHKSGLNILNNFIKI